MLPKVIAVVGPTAVGKTSLSIQIAQEVEGEVVSADSRQVYRGLDIGTGKVTFYEMHGVPHHLLDVADPTDIFTASDFLEQGRRVIYEITQRGHMPVIAGGTGFYIDALLGRVLLPEVPPNEEVREKLEVMGITELQKLLKQKDPRAFERMDTENPRRLIRALEIVDALGAVPELTPQEPRYDVLWIGITLPLPELAQRIQARLTARLETGMVEEAKRLFSEGVSYERMEQLGLEYRFMARHLQGLISYDEMVAQLNVEIFKYAKRQMTWFKKNKDIHWLAPNQTKEAFALAKVFLEN